MRTKNSQTDRGFHDGTIILTVLAGLFIITSSAGLMTRTFIARKSAMKQSQALSAEQTAEAGIAELKSQLLTDPYQDLLLRNNSQWAGMAGQDSCGSSLPDPIALATSGNVGSSDYQYELISYTYSGNNYFGGTGEIKMRGNVLKNGSVIASSIVTQSIAIDSSKPCGGGNEGDVFAGLLVTSGTLGGNDVLGGSVVCTGCTAKSDMGANSNTSVVTGDIYVETSEELGVDINDYPDISAYGLTFPAASASIVDGCITTTTASQPSTSIWGIVASLLDPIPAAYANNGNGKGGDNGNGNSGDDGGGSGCGTLTIEASTADRDAGLSEAQDYCQYTADGDELICQFDQIDYSGNDNLVITSTSDISVTIYLTGTGSGSNSAIKFSGNGGINHTGPQPLKLYGNKENSNSSDDQTVELRGNTNVGKVFIRFPDGHVGVKGGGGPCDTSTYRADSCQGDIYGAVWAKTWGQIAGNPSNVAQIVVPEDFNNDFDGNEGNAYPKTARGIGVRSHSSRTAN